MSKSTYASSTAEGGKLGVYFSRGSGLGNYTIGSQANFTILDPNNLSLGGLAQTNDGGIVFIPRGFIAIVRAGGSVSTLAAAVQASVGLFVDGALVVEQDITGPGASTPAIYTYYSSFSLNWVVQGDNKFHSIGLGARTANAADAVSILNSTPTNAPYLMVEITQSSFVGAPAFAGYTAPATAIGASAAGWGTFGSAESEARFSGTSGRLGVIFQTGSGFGNYFTNSSSFQPVDGGGGQLTINAFVPRGFVLLVTGGGTIGSTSGMNVAVGIADTVVSSGTTVLRAEQDTTPHGTTQFSPFGVNCVIQGDDQLHQVALVYHSAPGGFSASIGNTTSTNVPFILAELTQSNIAVAGVSKQTQASSQAEGGNLGCVFLTGSGTGNYQTSSQSFTNVDTTLLSYGPITIPMGFVLVISGAGTIGSVGNFGPAPVAAGILVDGVLQSETVVETAASTLLTGFNVQYVLVGDGNAHTVALAYHTMAAATSAIIGNNSTTNTPSLLLKLTQSNVN